MSQGFIRVFEFKDGLGVQTCLASRGGDHVGALPDGNQLVNYLRRAHADHFVSLLFIGTKLEHIAQHRNFAPSNPARRFKAASIDSGEAL